MSTTPLFIPKKLKIGFQNRSDTHTGKLAYIIYYDERNKLRKEASWKSWCDPKIQAIEIDNTANGGYVLNKGVRRYSDWGSGRSVIRIWDPRDFEFEISVDNLIGLLSHSDVSSGEIFEKCVFAWKGSELVLLPCNSQQYTESVKFTEIQDGKLSTKDLVPGMVYPKKKTSRETYTYIGFYDWFEYSEKDIKLNDGTVITIEEAKEKWGQSFLYSSNYGRDGSAIPREMSVRYGSKSKGRKHVFLNNQSKKFECVSIASLSPTVIDDQTQNIANLIDKFNRTFNSSEVVGFHVVEPQSFGYKLFKVVGSEVLWVPTSVRGRYAYSGKNEGITEVRTLETTTYMHVDGDVLCEQWSHIPNNNYYYSSRLQRKYSKSYITVEPEFFVKECNGYYEEFKLSNSGAKKLFDTRGFGVLQLKLKNGNCADVQTSYY